MNITATRLVELRSKKGVTQEVVAEACGISRVTLARYENGTRKKPVPENLFRLAEYYDVSVDYLLGREDHKENPVNVQTLVGVSGSMGIGKSDRINKILAKMERLDESGRKTVEDHIDFLLSRKKGE